MKRLLKREEAASYCGIGPTKFDELVSRGTLPAPIRLDGCVRWDVRQLDIAVDRIAEGAPKYNHCNGLWAVRHRFAKLPSEAGRA